jgi:hypothetical protein
LKASQQYSRAWPNSLIIFCFDPNEFSVKKYSILNNFSTVLQNIMKSRDFQWYQKHNMSECGMGYQKHNKSGCGMGDLNVANKINKQTTFLCI